MLRAIVIAGASLALAGCHSPMGVDYSPVTRNDTLGNFDKTFWNVSDRPRVGTVVRMTWNRSRLVTASQYSQWLASTLPENISEQVSGLDQTVTISDSQHGGLAFGLLKKLGIDISGSIDRSRTTSLEFSGVRIGQFRDALTVIQGIQTVDMDRGKDETGKNLMSLINSQTGPEIVAHPERSRYWIVTKVFTPSKVAWKTSGDSKGEVKVVCTALKGNCGSIEASGGGKASGTASGTDQPLYVVIKPLYTSSGNIRLGEIAPTLAPKEISG